MATEASPPAPAPPGAHLGERRLTTLHAVGQALAIGPMFSAGLVSGLIAHAAGFTTPLSVLLGSIGALGLAYVIVVYARRYAGAGAIYEYLAHAVHNSFGMFSASVYLLGTLFLGAGGIFIGLGFLTQGFFATHLHADIAWWLGGAAALMLTFVLNHFGVRIAVRGVLLLAGFSAIPFLILAVAIIAKGGVAGNTLAVFDPGQTSWNSTFTGILFAVTLFVGFEAAASIAEETHEPRKSIPIAVLTTVALSGAFYLLVTYAATIGFGKAGLAKDLWFGSASPMGDLAKQYVGQWLSVLVDLVVILDALSLSIAIMVTASRVLFALGRDGLLPRWTAATSRHDTPLAGNVIITVWAIALLVWAGVTHYGRATKLPDPVQAFFITTATGSYLIELVYIFLAIFALKLLFAAPREGGMWWKVIAVLVGLATPVLAFKGSLDPFPQFPNNRAVFFAIACIVISAVWYLIVRLTRPQTIASAARHAVQHEGVPPLDEPLVAQHGAGGYLKD
jgi:amino acid transporter